MDALLPSDILRCAALRRLFLRNCTLPDAAGFRRGADVFPRLLQLCIWRTVMSNQELDHLPACSPALESLALFFNTLPTRVRLCNQSLHCVLLFAVEEVAVVDAPLLQRLVLWRTFHWFPIKVKLSCALELRILGYLEPRAHQLQIGETIIKADTGVNPSSVVPSIKILALRVNFGVLKEVTMLVSFLRCFPNVETLHIESVCSAMISRPAAKQHVKFWQEVRPVECIKSHLKKIVVHGFGGKELEFEFLKFIRRRSQELLALLLVLTSKFASVDVTYEVNC